MPARIIVHLKPADGRPPVPPPHTGPAVNVNTDAGTPTAGVNAIAVKNATGPASRMMRNPS